MLRKPLVILIIDLVLINLCIISIFSIRFIGGVPARNINAYINTYYYITVIFAILMYVQGLYDFDETDDSVSIFFKVFSVIGLGIVSLMALTFFSRAFAFPRTVIVLSYLLLVVLISLWRLFVHHRFLMGLPPRRAVVYGDPGRFQHLKSYMRKNLRRYEYVGGIRKGEEADLFRKMESGEVDCVLITDRIEAAQETAFEIFLKFPGIIVFLVPKPSNIIAGARHQVVLGDVPLVAFSHKAILGRYFLMKRLIDIIGSVAALMIFAPLLLLVAIAVKVTSPGPVFYSQPRVGRNGKIFVIHKFRTMRQDAEEETGPVMSSAEDPRVTTLGRYLRRFKIDELPQFVNVLKGEMSIVGPRPERPNFVAEFEREYPGYSERRKVPPGITGLAQVSAFYETDPSVKLMYDMIYIYNYHPLMDFAIAYRTFQFVMRENIG